MNTANKISVADRDDASLVKTLSGGVDEPSDPRHFPELGNSALSPRAMSRLGDSFKDRLLTNFGDDSGISGHAGASGSEAAKVDHASYRNTRISARRKSSGRALKVALDEEQGSTAKASQQGDAVSVMAERDSQGESWEPVSPKKHISLRRRTADEEAERAALEGTVFRIPSHLHTFGALSEPEEKVLEAFPEERNGDNFAHEGLEEGSRGASDGGAWEHVEAGVQWVVDNPAKVAAVVGMAMGAIFFMRRRRLF